MDVIKKAAPHPIHPAYFWHQWLWDVHQTLDADITGHLWKIPRVRKKEKG